MSQVWLPHHPFNALRRNAVRKHVTLPAQSLSCIVIVKSDAAAEGVKLNAMPRLTAICL